MGPRPRSSLKFEWDIVMQLPGICGVHYKSTTSTVGRWQTSLGFACVQLLTNQW